jgi:hypothetical protein
VPVRIEAIAVSLEDAEKRDRRGRGDAADVDG